jgi:HSP20 family protein
MALVRWSPVTGRDLITIQDEVNQLFDSVFGRAALRDDLAPGFTPAVDVEELAEEFVVRVDLPGVSPKDVKVSLIRDTLTIRGERKQDRTTKNGGRHRVERTYGSFERSFTLGTPVRSDKVQATYRDGVLEIHVPKAEEARVREIEVQVGA